MEGIQGSLLDPTASSEAEDDQQLSTVFVRTVRRMSRFRDGDGSAAAGPGEDADPAEERAVQASSPPPAPTGRTASVSSSNSDSDHSAMQLLVAQFAAFREEVLDRLTQLERRIAVLEAPVNQ